MIDAAKLTTDVVTVCPQCDEEVLLTLTQKEDSKAFWTGHCHECRLKVVVTLDEEGYEPEPEEEEEEDPEEDQD